MKEQPKNATARWFLGRAKMAQAEELRRNDQPGDALGVYGEAIQDWRASARMQPSFTPSCNQSIAGALVGTAALELDEGEVAKADAHLDEAFQVWPGIFDRGDSFGCSYLTLKSRIGRRLLGGDRGWLSANATHTEEVTTEQKMASLRRAVEFHRTLIARHGDHEEYLGFWYNNLGLALRDLGTLQAAAKKAPVEGLQDWPGRGAPPEAVASWQEALEAYEKAMTCLPEDSRLVNDCALMLVYHLGRDLPRAEKLFRQAIDLGKGALAAKEAAGDLKKEDRNFLEEAVGDAWQNLGLLHFWHDKEKKAALPFFKEALAYFPYGGRAVTGLIRQIEGPGVRDAASGNQARTGDKDPVVAEAEKLLAEAAQADAWEAKGAFADAAFQIEKLLAKAQDKGRVRLILARTLQGLSNAEKGSRKPNMGTAMGFLEEATAKLKAAVQDDPDLFPAWLLLVSLELELGDSDGAAAAARPLAGLLAKKGKELNPADRNQMASMAGHALYISFARGMAAAAQANADPEDKVKKDGADAVALLDGVFQTALKNKGTVPGVSAPAVVAVDLAKVHQWQGDLPRAVQVLAEWIGATKPTVEIMQELFNIGRSKGSGTGPLVEAFTAILATAPDDPTILWYHGAAHCEAGDNLRRLGKYDEADKHYDRAVAALRRVIELNPAFKASSQTFIVRSLSGKGYAAKGRKDWKAAGEHFLAALRENPELRNTQDSGRLHPALGIAYVTDHYLKSNEPMAAIELYQKALAVVPQEVDWSNNMALTARDLGTALQRRDPAQAEKLFRISLEGYRNAVKYSDKDPRLLNDLALIMIYHVPSEREKARPYLLKAVEEGAKQLASFPTDDPGGRQLLDEAVGDAWQNIGYLDMVVAKDYDAAEKAFKESLKHFSPTNRAEVRRHMARLHRLMAEAKKKDGAAGGGEPR